LVNLLYGSETSEFYTNSRIIEDEKSSKLFSLEIKNIKYEIELLTLIKVSLEALDESENIEKKKLETNHKLKRGIKLKSFKRSSRRKSKIENYFQ